MELLRDIRGLDSTAVVLIRANLLPLYGVFAWGWAVFPILSRELPGAGPG